ncbi:pentraxin fusion protein-like [Spea bombifrons]|uniref:pentraxin fusion protein-like n=1 Tax=Spea bombifrons TaxID=233779 RepID=UPI00234A743E|nr:pentraxin fusion protein-like [Spea bombifrons]
MKCFLLLLVCGAVGWAQFCGLKPGAVNLARWGTASQSSTYNYHLPPGEASLAIDGNKETNYYLHACAHTNGDYGAWWRLDLHKSFKIDAVVIVNRMDCCQNRLHGAQIRVGNSGSNNDPLCGTITDVSQSCIPLCCKGMEGRFITVTIPGRAEYLTLCEVEVYGQAAMEKPQVSVNLARSGTASQSSTYSYSVPTSEASLAIDGNKETNYHLHACAHTNGDYGAWWRLDLQKSFKIDAVVIVNRMDCCQNRLHGAQIRVGNSGSNNDPLCGTITDVSQSCIPLCCNGMEGRYITVTIPGRAEYLTLCEVEVYGRAAMEKPQVCW